MTSFILSALMIDVSKLWSCSEMNLFHGGDDEPFANLFVKDGKTWLRVGSGEMYPHASNVKLDRYG